VRRAAAAGLAPVAIIGPSVLKLLFVIKSLALPGGGAERVLAEVAAGLARAGHDVAVVSFDAADTTDFYPFAPPIRRFQLAIGPCDARSGLHATLRRIAALRSFVRAERPDVAVGFMHSAYIPLGLALAGTKIPSVASEHIVYSHYDDRRAERILLRAASPLLDSFTAISPEMRQGFPGKIARKMAIMPNPVQAAKAQADVAGGTRKTLVTVGRLEPQKDHRTLIDAFARIAQRFPAWDLRILGEGVLRPALEEQVRALGLADRVALPGAISDIGAAYASAQLFVMPSLYESFGLATAEAMAHGLPAVGFADCPGTNELIVDGVNGLLVSGADRAGVLAEGLARLMDGEADRARMGAAAPAGVAAFMPDRIVARWESLLENVARGTAGPALALRFSNTAP
jgi:glycosyltransferase involved in cell wall biosynthesis